MERRKFNQESKVEAVILTAVRVFSAQYCGLASNRP